MNNLAQKAKIFYRAWRYRFLLDPGEIKYIRANLSYGDIAIDIGAHKGGYTYWMQKAVGANGTIICFEPQTELAKYLKTVIGISRWAHVSIENMAISNKTGEMELYVPGNTPSPGASLVGAPDKAEGRRYKVIVESLDHYLNINLPNKRINFIKIDVEGHELEVFKGAENTLKNSNPILLFECEQRHHKDGNMFEVFSYLESLNYTGYFFWQDALLPLTEFDLEKHQVFGKKPYANNFVFKSRG